MLEDCLLNVIVLPESSSFSLVFKPIDNLQQSPNLPQVGATPFFHIYQFIILLPLFTFSFYRNSDKWDFFQPHLSLLYNRPCRKGKYWNMDNIKIAKERGNPYWKNEEISIWKAHINTAKLHWNILTITVVFLDQKKVYLLSSDRERHLWLSKRFSEAPVCLCVPFIWRSLHSFGKNFPLSFSIFVC